MRLNRIFLCTGCFLLCLLSHESIGQTEEYLIQQADRYFHNHQFFKAILIYQQLQRSHPDNSELVLKRAITEYETNSLDSAAALSIRYLDHNGKKSNIARYLYGKILMSKGKFAEAAANFKQSLLHTAGAESLHQKLIDEIKRCGTGEVVSMQSNQIVVESAGIEVNTIWDEINPVPSINSDSRIYFNSNRESISAMGNTGESYELPFDMYASTLTNGEWSDIGPLNAELNTRSHELLADFDEKGQVVYFKRGNRLADLNFVTDTFNPEGHQRAGRLDIPFIQGQDDILFFNDSIVLFSSNRQGGFGGYDLYYTMKQSGSWSIPVNLGNKINTPFDEVNPFLAFDGRTLIFSSNSTAGMGGFDLFSSYFDDHTGSWSAPVNLGMPINSSEDERYFRLNKNRLSALFSSNRKSGVGGYDIYFAYFPRPWAPQLERSRPLFFGQLNQDHPTGIFTSDSKPAPVLLSAPTIFYESDDQLSLSSITKKLDEVTVVLQQNANLNMIIETFSDRSNSSLSQALVYSVKRAETIKDYFTNHGVRPSQILIKGYGSNFPMAIEQIHDKPNPAGQSLNKRIEFTFFQTEPGMELKYQQVKESVAVNLLIKTNELDQFRMKEKNLNYKVLLLSASNPANLESYIGEDSHSFFIEKNNSNGKYELMSGVQNEYALANKSRKEWVAKGFEDAAVVAYIDNARIALIAMSKWAEKYPDLVNYIYRSE